MNKLLIFPSNTDRGRDLFFVKEDRSYLLKQAASGKASYHPKVVEYIKNAAPMKDLVQVLLTALGAYEFWGQNVNGDRFREAPLSHEGNDFGYQTFKSNANYFTHHVNKDPALAKGKVLHAVWNEKSKRVELIVGIDINLDPDAISSVDRGESLAFSMGAKVPFDVCSICGNRARTRAEYCDHLRYQMNQMDPSTGKLIGADNTMPKFFDISRVLIPADKTAYMWTKVASAAGENPFSKLSSAYLAELPPGKLNDIQYLSEKVAEQRSGTDFGTKTGSTKVAVVTKKSDVSKRAEITKRIEAQGIPIAGIDHLEKVIPPSKALLEATSPALPPEVIARLRALAPSLGHLLSTIISLGIEPKASEVTMMMGSEAAPESSMLQGNLFSPDVAQELLPFLPERSFARPHLARRLLILAQKLEDGDPAVTKKAQDLSKVADSTTAGTIAGELLGSGKGGMNSDALSALIHHVTKYPLVYAALAAILYPIIRAGGGTRVSGIYDVDDKKRPLYNNDWQSRFVEMQARPVTVIKTGAVDTELAKKVYYGVPLIYGASQVSKIKRDVNTSQGQPTGKITHFVADHPELVAGGMFAEHFAGRPVSKHVAKAIESGKRLFKHASIRNIEFLENLPEEDKPLFWDIAILDASARIAKKIGG